jgi:hypothetical protein
MISYRVTKYNPSFRNAKGAYQKDEWISFSDVDRTFAGVELTAKDYIHTEAMYISAIHSFMRLLDINSLNVSGLEKNYYSLTEHDQKYIELYPETMTQIVASIQNGESLQGNRLDDFCKMCLRSQIWGRLEYPEKMFVHFGNDYYMYIGVSHSSKVVVEEIENTGMFVEPFESPYLEVAD